MAAAATTLFGIRAACARTSCQPTDVEPPKAFCAYSVAMGGFRPTVASSVAAASPTPTTKWRRGIAVTTTNPGLIKGANQPWLGTSVNETTRRRLP